MRESDALWTSDPVDGFCFDTDGLVSSEVESASTTTDLEGSNSDCSNTISSESSIVIRLKI